MPVFISYSHENKKLVDVLAANLVANKVHVWVDRWALSVGDSLIQKVQDAITESSALLVVLSKDSVESEWCKKELGAGLMRELEEKRVVVMPLLLEDCEIPIFLRDKLYADFRKDFDQGFKDVLKAISKVTNPHLTRFDAGEYKTDLAVDWGIEDDQLFVRITLVEQVENKPFVVLSEVTILANEPATARYIEIAELGLDWFGVNCVVGTFVDFSNKNDFIVSLEDQRPQALKAVMSDINSDKEYFVIITSRRLGEDTGDDIVVYLTKQLNMLQDYIVKTSRPLTEEELRALDIKQ